MSTSLEASDIGRVCSPADFAAPAKLSRAHFLAGVDAAPAHIAAGYDVLRPKRPRSS